VKSGAVLFAHGSPVEAANEAVRVVAERVQRAGPFEAVEIAFLEHHPLLEEAVARLAASGVSQVVIVPYFLTMGLHLERDLPRLVEEVLRLQPNLSIRVTRPLDGHPALVDIVLDRLREK
jgi:sirohydrochlorin ferrochelatase